MLVGIVGTACESQPAGQIVRGVMARFIHRRVAAVLLAIGCGLGGLASTGTAAASPTEPVDPVAPASAGTAYVTYQGIPIEPGTYILWKKSLNKVLFVRNGAVVRAMPATDLDWKTPVGNYRIRFKVPMGYSGQWRLQYFMGFYLRPGASYYIGFHMVPRTASGVWIQPLSTVGMPGYSSHGCVRLRPDDALAAWNFAPVGTVVKVR